MADCRDGIFGSINLISLKFDIVHCDIHNVLTIDYDRTSHWNLCFGDYGVVAENWIDKSDIGRRSELVLESNKDILKHLVVRDLESVEIDGVELGGVPTSGSAFQLLQRIATAEIIND